MFKNLSWLLLVLAAIVVPSFVSHIFFYGVHDAFLRDEKAIEVWWLVVYIFVGPTIAALARISYVEELVGFRRCEAFAILLSVFVACREVLLMSHGSLTLPQLALGLDAVVTAVHLALPIRWCVILWADLFFVFGFAGWCVIHSRLTLTEMEMSDEVYILAVFFGLVLAASLGLRSAELADRRHFTTVVDERSLRARAEFDLEQVIQGDQGRFRPAGVRSGSEGGSTANTGELTTNTGQLFKALGEREHEDAVSQNSPFERGVPQQLVSLGTQEHWLIPERELKIFIGKVLGRGGFGQVVQGRYCCTPVAVKLVAEGSWGSNFGSALSELRVLRHLRHPNIALFHGACMTQDENGMDLKLVFEQVRGKTLKKFVPLLHGLKEPPLNREQMSSCMSVMNGITQALVYLHTKTPAIVHADLKPSNVMVQGPWRKPDAKLLDFGMSRVVSRHAQVSGGTQGFRAPEVGRSGVKASPAVDIFSLGRILMFLAGARPGVTMPEPWRETVSECTSQEPHDRPKAEDIYEKLFRQADDEEDEDGFDVSSGFFVNQPQGAGREDTEPQAERRRGECRASL